MKQSPLRRLRRDRSRLVQEHALALGTGDKDKAAELDQQIADLDKQIVGQEARQAQLGKG